MWERDHAPFGTLELYHLTLRREQPEVEIVRIYMRNLPRIMTCICIAIQECASERSPFYRCKREPSDEEQNSERGSQTGW